MVIVAVFYIPTRIGGWGHIFAAGQAHLKAINPVTHKPNGVFIPTTRNSQLAFSTLALGSALALMVYPHSVTGVLSTKRRDIIKRNMALLPIYSVMLGFVALLGYMAWPTRRRSRASRRPAATRSSRCRTCSSTCSPAGSPESPSRPS